MLTELLVGFVLLMSPYDENNTIEVDFQTRMAAAEWAIKFELFDAKSRESLKDIDTIVVFNGLEYEVLMPNEIISILQKTNKNLKDAPKTEDLFLFPDSSFLKEQMVSNEIFSSWLYKLKEISPPWNDEILGMAQRETAYLHKLHYSLYVAKNEEVKITERRYHLNLYRDMVGHENYYTGCLFPTIPYWHFQR